MSLHGTLETFALPDVMALLAATKKTGELRVVGGRIDGRVYLDAGRVVFTDVGRADSFVDAVFELLRLDSGKFSFDADRLADDPTEPVEIEPLLLEAGARLTEWKAIEEVVPSMDHGVTLVADLSDPHVTLASDQWRMVVAVAGARCVHEVAERLGLGEYGACKSLKNLVESGVVVVSDPPAAAPAPSAAPAAAVAKAEPAPEAPAKAKPEPVAQAEPAVPAEAAEAPAAEPTVVEGKAKPIIEPQRKPDASVGGVDVPALTTRDHTSPIPPGAEPGGPAKAKKAAAKSEAEGDAEGKAPAADPAKAGAVTSSQAKQLVSQLAALGSEKASSEKGSTPAEAPQAAPAKGDPQASQGESQAGKPAADAEGGEGEEPLNRGLLLKFLSSVRQ